MLGSRLATLCLLGLAACTAPPRAAQRSVPVPQAPSAPLPAATVTPAEREVPGTVTTLATGLTNPDELLVDATHVWVCSHSALLRLEKHRAAPPMAIDVGGQPVDVADRGPSLIVGVHHPPHGWKLVDVDKQTLAVRTLATALEAQHVAVTGDAAIAADATGRIVAVTSTQREIASGQGHVSDMVAGAGRLCWASNGDLAAAMMAGKPLPGAVTCADSSGANKTVLARPLLPSAVVLTPSQLVYADSEGVFTIRGAGPAERLHESAGSLFAITGLAADEREVIFGSSSVTGDAPGKLMRFAAGDVGARELASFSGAVTALALDEHAVYASNMHAGSVIRVAR
ncbi:MAG: hypothetical protein HYZ29_15075 [Myxococcales bacterium]|nr:hypothetical protein [Myxococcales bacterium]